MGYSRMIRARIKGDDVIKMLKNSVEYSSAFATELNKSKAILNQKLGSDSIEIFYDYLDGLARSHPGMLHHVYEWGQVGNPMGRLYDLTLSVNNTSAVIDAKFLESTVPSPTSNEPFYDKAKMMEDGETVVINQVEAKALFFEIDGEEFFRTGPIVIANPGGSAVRGSFVKAFNEFYGVYFTQVHLESIKFYKYFSNPRAYEKYFASAVKGGGARSKGKKAALSWIMNAPGGS
jgi:hypothetical protein